MAFFAILFALMAEQLYPLPLHNPVYVVHRQWCDWSARHFSPGAGLQGWLPWALAVVLPAALVALAYAGLRAAGWPLAWLFSALVLYVTLGFRQFSHHITAIRDALDVGDERAARQLLAQWKQLDTVMLPRHDLIRQVLEHAVLDAHRHVFGVLVAFVLCAAFGLGPAGAVLFRSAEFVTRHWRVAADAPFEPDAESLHQHAVRAWNWINWLPARATAAIFAAAGNFEQAVDNWRQQTGTQAVDIGHADSDAVVLASAMGAIDMPWPLAPWRAASAAPRLDAPGAAGQADFPGPAEAPVDVSYVDLADDPASFAGPAADAAALAAGVQPPLLTLQHLQLLVGMVWRSVLVWGGLIALVAVTHWVSVA